MSGAVQNKTMYEHWAESVPGLPFPFVYQGRGLNLKRSWGDVREGFQRDGVNSTLHRSTGHITATSFQSAIVREEIRASEKYSPRPPNSSRGNKVDGSIPRSAAAVLDSSRIPPIPSPPRSAREQPGKCSVPLLATAGRHDYLLSRRRAPYTEDCMVAGFTSSNRAYGGSLLDSHLPPVTPEFHRKVCGLRDAFRPKYVFAPQSM